MFVEVFLFGLLAGISPGPDFIVVTKNSIGHGKYIGIASALGVAVALAIHATYSILGLFYILINYSLLFKIVQLTGAAYLAYLGIVSIWSTFKKNKDEFPFLKGDNTPKSFLSGFRDGFLCNILNPKAYVFFLSIFSQFMSPTTPIWVEWIYATEVVVVIGSWFVFVSVAISTSYFSNVYSKARKWIDRCLGSMLLFFAGKIATSVVMRK
jgi:RhtB (resistance to homoserine/threonine) family protein